MPMPIKFYAHFFRRVFLTGKVHVG